MYEDLDPGPGRNGNNGNFNTDPKNHVPDHSVESCEHYSNAFNLEDEKAVRSLLPVNNLQLCTLEYQKALEDSPASRIHRVNREEATSTRTRLDLEVGSKETITSQG